MDAFWLWILIMLVGIFAQIWFSTVKFMFKVNLIQKIIGDSVNDTKRE